jgi:hypothetical protein
MKSKPINVPAKSLGINYGRMQGATMDSHANKTIRYHQPISILFGRECLIQRVHTIADFIKPRIDSLIKRSKQI